MSTTLKKKPNLTDCVQPPKPPTHGGDDDPWEDDPEGKPSIEAYLKMPASLQAQWYRKILRHRQTLQLLHLRETAECIAESWARVHGRAMTEKDVRDELSILAIVRQGASETAERWVQNPSEFRPSSALALLYSGEFLGEDDDRADWFLDLAERVRRQEEEQDAAK